MGRLGWPKYNGEKLRKRKNGKCWLPTVGLLGQFVSDSSSVGKKNFRRSSLRIISVDWRGEGKTTSRNSRTVPWRNCCCAKHYAEVKRNEARVEGKFIPIFSFQHFFFLCFSFGGALWIKIFSNSHPEQPPESSRCCWRWRSLLGDESGWSFNGKSPLRRKIRLRH